MLLRRLLKYWDGSRVEAAGRMARSEGGASPSAGCNERATQPAALLPRAGDGCVDFGVGLRCSLGRDRSGYRHCASRLGQRQNPQQRGPFQYFNSLLGAWAISRMTDSRRRFKCLRSTARRSMLASYAEARNMVFHKPAGPARSCFHENIN